MSGPLFGPDFVEVTVNDDTGTQFTLQVYPDAHNGALKAAGLPQQFYFQPQRVVIAKKQDHPADYDFGMTVFKGLASMIHADADLGWRGRAGCLWVLVSGFGGY